MKSTLSAAAFLLASSMAAQATMYAPAQEFIDNPDAFPACQTKSGLPVRYIFTVNVFWGPASASLEKDRVTGERRAYISYTPHFQRFSAKEQVFSAEHECAHHKLGHLEGDVWGLSPEERKVKELEADCEAARELKRKHAYGRADLREAMGVFLKQQETEHYPEGAARWEHALKCFEASP